MPARAAAHWLRPASGCPGQARQALECTKVTPAPPVLCTLQVRYARGRVGLRLPKVHHTRACACLHSGFLSATIGSSCFLALPPTLTYSSASLPPRCRLFFLPRRTPPRSCYLVLRPLISASSSLAAFDCCQSSVPSSIPDRRVNQLPQLVPAARYLQLVDRRSQFSKRTPTSSAIVSHRSARGNKHHCHRHHHRHTIPYHTVPPTRRQEGTLSQIRSRNTPNPA